MREVNALCICQEKAEDLVSSLLISNIGTSALPGKISPKFCKNNISKSVRVYVGQDLFSYLFSVGDEFLVFIICC